MPVTPILIIHISGAIIGLLSGYAAMLFRKGGGMHGAAGTLFFASMLGMSGSAVYIATFVRPTPLNVEVGLLTFYLVATAWRAGRKRVMGIDAFDVVAFVWILGDGIMGMVFASRAAKLPPPMPGAIYGTFATVALLCAVSDVRMLVRGGVAGSKRIARHLWRMCLALLIATLSLFPGQARQFPAAVKKSALIYTPHLFLIVAMIYWIVRVSRGRGRVGGRGDVGGLSGGRVVGG